MGRINHLVHSFSNGLISPLALARVDIPQVGLSAETYNNFMPRFLGSMMLRPGSQYIGATASNNAAKFIPFVFSTDDTVLIEITNVLLRIWDGDALVTRASVSSAVTDGTFVDGTSTNAAWTDNDTGDAVSAWESAGGTLQLSADPVNRGANGRAIRRQQVTVAGGDQNVEHSLKLIIQDGITTFKIGSSTGGDEYFSYDLGSGEYSLTFTPAGDFHIEFSVGGQNIAHVTSVAVESSGTMSVASPWAAADLSKLRYVQSGDVVYIACDGYEPYKIERRTGNSWSAVKYLPRDGPFRQVNLTNISQTASNSVGLSNLTASEGYFTTNNLDSLFRLRSKGQRVNVTTTSDDAFTYGIKVEGADDARIISFVNTITGTATLTLQRSFISITGPWEDEGTTYTVTGSPTFYDTFGDQTIYYRIGVKSGDLSSGTVTTIVTYENGFIDGVIRLSSVTSETLVTGLILSRMGNLSETDEWNEGSWSTRRGFPSGVALAEGRLCWAGKNGVWLSKSDDYENFNDLGVGDARTIFRTIGVGPVDTINWLLSLDRLLLGTDGDVFTCKASSDDEILTAENFNIRPNFSQGTAKVVPVKMDDSGIFVQRGGTRLMKTDMDGRKYKTSDLTSLYPEAGTDSEITHIAIQRQPETRIHCMRADGTVAILMYDELEQIICWLTYSTDGTVEDIVVLPGADGSGEDAVYYLVNRTINSSTVRLLERWALESDCRGASVSRNIDSHIVISQASSTTISGLTHLEAETVYLWANGKDLGSYTVASGAITASEAVTTGCVGLTYTAQWKSTKLAYAAGMGTALMQKKLIKHLGLILKDSHYQGLEYGPDFSNLDPLPLVSKGVAIDDDTVHSTFDEEMFEFPGEWDTDARLCLQAVAPKPVTVLAAVVGMETLDKD